MKDDLLVDLSRQMPHNDNELTHIRGLGDGVRRKHGEALLKIINEAREQQPDKLSIPPRKPKLNTLQDAALDVLTAVAKTHADQLKINASVLAPRKSLEDLIRGNHDTPVMKGWRKSLIGEPIISVLDGETRLRFVDGKLNIDH